MPLVESERRLPVQRPVPSEDALLIAVAAGFLIFHILVAVMLMPASARGPVTSQEDVLSRLYD